MECQKHLFSLPEGVHYLNCAYMSPLMRSVEEKGIVGLRRKRDPSTIVPSDFFSEVEELRRKFGTLVNASPSQVAVMPSVSYGMNSVLRNIPHEKGQHALTVSEVFPSCYYSARRWCGTHGAVLKTVAGGSDLHGRAADWNQRILEAVNGETAFLVMPHVHWMNGTKFDLGRIGERCREVGAKLIIDGSQSVGALPMDVRQHGIDALVCAGYKWLMGPYSSALAYVGEAFNGGIPLEESWMARPGAEVFSELTAYTDQYKPGAARYDMCQSSNFISIPMLNEALRQILEWGTEAIQAYCREISLPFFTFCRQSGIVTEEESGRANHLVGIRIPGHVDATKVIEDLQERKVFVSLRGFNLRVSFHLFNDHEDIRQLISALQL